MSERDEQGQFTVSEPAFGREALEQENGYIPMPDEEQPDELTVNDAVAQYSTPESDIITHVAGADMPDNMTMTAEQAAKALTEAREADETQAKDAADEALRKEVDELRGEKPEQEAKAPEEPQPVKDGELDPDIEKALSNPKIKAAIDAQINEIEAAKQTHIAGLQAATEMVKASLLGQFPEVSQIASLPPEQQGAAIAALMQNEPGRAEALARSLHNMQNLMQQQAVYSRQQTERENAEFQAYAKAEDERFDAAMKGETKESLRALQGAVLETLREYGVTDQEFVEVAKTNKFLRSAAAQRILVDAAKYRMVKNAKAIASRQPLPPVQRPGVARPQSRENGIEALTEKFRSNPSLKNAAEMRAAQIKARG